MYKNPWTLGNQVPVGSKIRSKKATRKPKRAIISLILILYFKEGGRINFFVYFVQDCACVVVNPCVSRINLRPSHPWYCSNYILQNGNMHTEQDTSSWRLSSKVFKSMEKVGHKLSLEILRGAVGWCSQKRPKRSCLLAQTKLYFGHRSNSVLTCFEFWRHEESKNNHYFWELIICLQSINFLKYL